MDCKFSTNGLAIDYFGTVKPCCLFQYDKNFQDQNNIKDLDVSGWHKSEKIISITNSLAQNQWPKECGFCQHTEANGRGDSMRLNGLSSYGHYSSQDITLEIRGGSTCNFACQTCWPQASSRVAKFYQQAKIQFTPPDNMDWDFHQLDSVKHRLRNIVLLGGEPFYDKRCLAFLKWLLTNDVRADITVFTNGSMIDWQFLERFKGRITLVFSIDAIGKPAEYIRFGSDWSTVKKNYDLCRSRTEVATRINITTSPYNYLYLEELLNWISRDWPEVVSFGRAAESRNSIYMDESIFRVEQRSEIIESLIRAQYLLKDSKIESMQKINAANAIGSIIKNLRQMPYNDANRLQFEKFIADMDLIKKININDYCPELARYFDINPTILDKVSSEFFESDI